MFFLQVVLVAQSLLAQPDQFSEIRKFREKGQYSDIVRIAEYELSKAKDGDLQRMLRFEAGIAHFELANAPKALEYLLPLAETRNNLTEYALYFVAQIYLKTQDHVKARKALTQLLGLSPNLKLANDANYQLALLEIGARDFRKAKGLLLKLERRHRREEKYPEILFQLARTELYLNHGSHYCRHIKRLFTGYPHFAKISHWGPRLEKNDFEGRVTGCSASFEDKKSRARNLKLAGLGERAKEEIQELRTQLGSEQRYELDRLEAYYLMQDGDAVKALAILTKYFQERHRDLGFLLGLASAAAKAGEFEAAVGSYYRAHKLSPRSKKGRQALYQAAFLSYQFQDYDGAARKFQEFTKLYSKSGLSKDAAWHLAWIRYLRGDYDGAYQALQPIRTRRGKRVSAHANERAKYWMAMSLYRSGKFDSAKTIFESLAKNANAGYYSVASTYRLKKLEALMPKMLTKSITTQAPLTRFSLVESPMPVGEDDFWSPPETVSEETESEESVAETAIEAEEENPESEEGEESVAENASPEINQEDEPQKTSFSNPVLVKRFERARELMILGFEEWAKWDLYDIEKRTSNREYLKVLMKEYQRVSNYHRSSYIGQVYFGAQRIQHGIEGVRYLWEYAFPKAFEADVMLNAARFGVPAELIWSIMRAESQYRRDAVSPVGALGLMQVMPFTGGKTSELLGESEFQPKSLLEPSVAIKIGARYLQKLLKENAGHIALVAASYNAGPHRVRPWLASFGHLDLDEFVEHIPFIETRNYVKKVMTNYQIYSHLYANRLDGLGMLSEPLNMRLADVGPSKETWF